MRRLGTALVVVVCPGALALRVRAGGDGREGEATRFGGVHAGDPPVSQARRTILRGLECRLVAVDVRAAGGVVSELRPDGRRLPWGQDLHDHALYLPGSWGGPATRSFTIPRGKILFVPLINAAYVLFPGDPVDWSFVTGFMAAVSAADLTVDGRRMDLFRPAYQVGLQAPFQAWFPDENLLGGPAGYYACGEDGYYAMLAPLSRGAPRGGRPLGPRTTASR